jgi:hypothetical protein
LLSCSVSTAFPFVITHAGVLQLLLLSLLFFFSYSGLVFARCQQPGWFLSCE